MTGGPNKYQVINLALSHIGQKPLTSTSDASLAAETTVQAVAALRVYDACLRNTLTDADWTFARVNEYELTDATYSTVNYSYAYEYPSNCIALRRIYNSETTKKDKGEPFEIAYKTSSTQQLILADISDAYARFTYYIIDTTQFPPKFVLALSHALAAALAVPLNGKEEQAKAEIAVYNAVLSEAQRIDSYESNEDESEENPFIDAR